jgi:hypothetical protein
MEIYGIKSNFSEIISIVTAPNKNKNKNKKNKKKKGKESTKANNYRCIISANCHQR